MTNHDGHEANTRKITHDDEYGKRQVETCTCGAHRVILDRVAGEWFHLESVRAS